MTFAAITICIASQQVFIVASIYFFIDSVRKLVDIPSYLTICAHPEAKKMQASLSSDGKYVATCLRNDISDRNRILRQDKGGYVPVIIFNSAPRHVGVLGE
jgi:hypothetical protein